MRTVQRTRFSRAREYSSKSLPDSASSLATEVGLSIANTSQHLQALRRAALVDGHKDGLFVYYRLAEPAVFELCAAVRRVAERRLADLERLLNEHFGDRSQPAAVGMRDLLERMRSSDVIVLDARPANEYAAGHIAGAISIPIEELQQRLRSLPRDSRPMVREDGYLARERDAPSQRQSISHLRPSALGDERIIERAGFRLASRRRTPAWSCDVFVKAC